MPRPAAKTRSRTAPSTASKEASTPSLVDLARAMQAEMEDRFEAFWTGR